MANLRSSTIRLAHAQPALRPHLLPLLTKRAGKADREGAEPGVVLAQVKARIIAHLAANMAQLANRAESGNRAAAGKFTSLLSDVTKKGSEIVGLGEALSEYVRQALEWTPSRELARAQDGLDGALAVWEEIRPWGLPGTISQQMDQAQAVERWAEDIIREMGRTLPALEDLS